MTDQATAAILSDRVYENLEGVDFFVPSGCYDPGF